MEVVLTIPDELAEPLRAAHGDDLARAALERLALDGYRTGRLSAFQVQKLLGHSDRFTTQAWLGRMGAFETYTLDDLEADRRTLEHILPG